MMQALRDVVNHEHFVDVEKERTRCFRCDALEDVVDEGVENGHRLVGDTSIGVDLLED